MSLAEWWAPGGGMSLAEERASLAGGLWLAGGGLLGGSPAGWCTPEGRGGVSRWTVSSLGVGVVFGQLPGAPNPC